MGKLARQRQELEEIARESFVKKVKLVTGIVGATLAIGAASLLYWFNGDTKVEGSTPIKEPVPAITPADSSNTSSGIIPIDSAQKQYTSLEEMMADFKDVPGEKEFHFTPGAKYTLVHVRQIHYHSELEDLPLEEKINIYKNMLQVHKEILQTIKHLKILGYNDVYLEGFSTEADMQRVRVELSGIEKNMLIFINAYEKDVALNGKSSEKIKESISNALDSIFSGIHGVYVADSKTSEYSVHPAELKQMHHMALSFNAATYDPREDVVLQKISIENGKSLWVVIFGGNHNWENNIQEFNKLPMKRGKTGNFNYIRITPDSYKEDSSK